MDSDHSDSAPELPDHLDTHKTKRRRLHGACDTCRKRKIKCDSAAMPDKVCTNCRTSNIECTHDIPRQPKKKDTQQAYIKSLEERLSKMERLLTSKNPGVNLENLLTIPPEDNIINAPSPAVSNDSSQSYPELRYPGPLHITSSSTGSEQASPGTPPNEADDLAHIQLAVHLSQLSMAEERFFGQSRQGSFMFAKQARSAKSEAMGEPLQVPLDASKFRRPLYWDLRPWERSLARTVERSFVFPDPGLLEELVELYFDKSNIFLPVIHKPTFMRSLRLAQHLSDQHFGMTVLLVCAIGSRYSNDPRVVLEGDETGLSSGWHYFIQVPIWRNYLFQKATIYDLQYYSLATTYLLGTSIPHASWGLFGIGVRFAIEKGLHRRKGFIKNSIEEEMARRAFWCLLLQDRWMSAFLGRPVAIMDEDFDTEFPAECDDEFWETNDPATAFKQPKGKPSQLSYLIAQIRLTEILAFTLRTLYSTKKSKMLTGMIGKDWEYQIVAELDSAMNKWKDSLPYYLRWDPQIPDQVFFHQSAFLHVSFFYLQIQVHRPFLAKKSQLSLPSLASCNNAARSCAHILEVTLTRGFRVFPMTFMSAFAAALVLLLNHWIQIRADPSSDTKKGLELYEKCMMVMKLCEKRWHIAGRLVDMLEELGYRTDQTHSAGSKRQRDSDTTNPVAGSSLRWSPSAFGSMGHAIYAPESPESTNLGTPPTKSVSPPAPNAAGFENASHMPANDWDFSNMLMMQMGYMQQQQQQHTAPAYVDPTAFPPTGQDFSALPASFSAPASSGTTKLNSGGPDPSGKPAPAPTMDGTTAIPDDLFTMWSNLPTSFSAQDWENFFGQSR